MNAPIKINPEGIGHMTIQKIIEKAPFFCQILTGRKVVIPSWLPFVGEMVLWQEKVNGILKVEETSFGWNQPGFNFYHKGLPGRMSQVAKYQTGFAFGSIFPAEIEILEFVVTDADNEELSDTPCGHLELTSQEAMLLVTMVHEELELGSDHGPMADHLLRQIAAKFDAMAFHGPIDDEDEEGDS